MDMVYLDSTLKIIWFYYGIWYKYMLELITNYLFLEIR